jgi:broad specificity phosphatase PhoE
MTEILYLIRHATPDWNRKDISYYLPPGLANFFQFSGLKHVYTSPMERCLMTAKAIAGQNGIILQIEPGLSEHRPEESRTDVQKRLTPIFEKAVREAVESPVALVTHGSPIEILLDQMGISSIELNELKTRFDHHNPAPPAGVWEAVRSGSGWNLSLVLDPQNARTEKLYGQI